MNLIQKLAQYIVKRGTVNTAHPRDPVLANWFVGADTASGVPMNAEQALRLTAVMACVKILAESVGSLPLVTYRRGGDDSKTRATGTKLYGLLHDKPNRWQTAVEYREMLQGHLALRGNSYVAISRDNAGAVAELIPLSPDRMRAYRVDSGGIAYQYANDNGGTTTFARREIHHIRAMTMDGITGLDPISYARESLGMTAAAEEFGARFFGNGTTLSGVLQHPGHLSEQAVKHLRDTFGERYSGTANAHKPIVLEEGMTWAAMGVEPDKAQFLETRKFQLEEVARLYRIPLHMLSHTEKATSWGSGIEQFNIGFVTHTLRPWFVRWEQAIGRDLIRDGTGLFAEFLIDGLLRGSVKDRYAAYAVGRQWGWLSINDVRRFENMDQIGEAGDIYLSPMNMVSADQAGDSEPDDDQRMLPFVDSAADRIVNCQRRALLKALDQADGDATEFEARAVEFVQKHGEFLRRHLEPIWVSGGQDDDALNHACNALVVDLTRTLNACLSHGLDVTRDTISDMSKAEMVSAIQTRLEMQHAN